MVSFVKRTPSSTIVVSSAAQLLGDIDSSKLYLIDGAIDLGSGSINVPETGLQLSGLGFDVSSITTTGTMFNYSGAYSGNLQIADLALTSPNVFDLDNDGNSGAIECDRINFVSCASLGELANYRQGLLTGSGVIFCTDGVTMSGTWSGGFAIITSIVIGGFTGTLFKAGVGLTIDGSFRSDINVLGIASGGAFCDFAPSNILSDGGFSMENVRVSDGVVAFPNMPRGDKKARYRNCLGQSNTYPGGQWTITTPAATTINSTNTLVKVSGTTTYEDLQWTTNGGGNNSLTYVSNQRIEVEIKCVLSVSGNNGDQVSVAIRQWDNSASSYINLSKSGAATLNASGRAEGIACFAYAELDENDRVEVWIENLSAARDVTVLTDGLFGVGER